MALSYNCQEVPWAQAHKLQREPARSEETGGMFESLRILLCGEKMKLLRVLGAFWAFIQFADWYTIGVLALFGLLR